MKFLIEKFLLLSASRSVAEIDMYKLVIALKDHYIKHPMILTFARMISLVDGDTDSSTSDERTVLTDEPKTDRAKLNNKLKMLHDDTTVLPQNRKIVFSDCAIPLPISSVYLFARSCLLREYSGIII